MEADDNVDERVLAVVGGGLEGWRVGGKRGRTSISSSILTYYSG